MRIAVYFTRVAYARCGEIRVSKLVFCSFFEVLGVRGLKKRDSRAESHFSKFCSRFWLDFEAPWGSLGAPQGVYNWYLAAPGHLRNATPKKNIQPGRHWQRFSGPGARFGVSGGAGRAPGLHFWMIFDDILFVFPYVSLTLLFKKIYSICPRQCLTILIACLILA